MESDDPWPQFIHGNVAVSRWTHPSGQRRVYLIVRGDGLFTRFSEHLSDVDLEMCWISDDLGASLYDSEETAVREIYCAYPWSREVSREDRPINE